MTSTKYLKSTRMQYMLNITQDLRKNLLVEKLALSNSIYYVLSSMAVNVCYEY
jgi:hypothetical protein